jgi:hypothetical protein
MNCKLHLQFKDGKIKQEGIGGHVARMGLVGKHGVKRPLGRPKRRWERWRVWNGFILPRIETHGKLL